jgi:alginate O-acetyltransferase complex protein AlgI
MRDRTLESVVARVPPWLLGTVWAALLWMIIVTQGSADSFIYFQF